MAVPEKLKLIQTISVYSKRAHNTLSLFFFNPNEEVLFDVTQFIESVQFDVENTIKQEVTS